MPKKKDADPNSNEPAMISKGYSEMLARLVGSKRGIKTELGRETGLNWNGVWRLCSHKKGASPRTARRLAEALQKRHTKIKIPPPVILVEGIEHYQWCEAGATLLRENPAMFHALMEKVAPMAKSLQDARDAIETATRELESLESSNSEQDDE